MNSEVYKIPNLCSGSLLIPPHLMFHTIWTLFAAQGFRSISYTGFCWLVDWLVFGLVGLPKMFYFCHSDQKCSTPYQAKEGKHFCGISFHSTSQDFTNKEEKLYAKYLWQRYGW